MRSPTFSNFERFFAIGSTQYASPDEMCPGLAWDRLKERKQNSPIDSPYNFEVGLKVYPHDFPNNGGQFYCMAAIPVMSLPSTIPLGYFVTEIPENQYAVFEVPTLDALKSSYNDIYHTWLPSSDYVACHGYDFEKFVHHPDYKIQIWPPISKKADALFVV